MEPVLLAAQDFDYGDFKEIPFSSPQTLFDFDLVMFDLRWLCFSYRFEVLEGYPNWAEPKRVMFRNGMKQKILRDRERRITEMEHLLDAGGTLVIILSIPIIFTFAEDLSDASNSQIIDNYSFLPLELEKQIRDKLVEGSGSKIEFRGNEALLPAWDKIKHISLYNAYFTSDLGNPFLYIKNTNYPVGSWLSYRNGLIFLIPGTPDDGGDEYPDFIDVAKQFANIVRTKLLDKDINLANFERKEASIVGEPHISPKIVEQNVDAQLQWLLHQYEMLIQLQDIQRRGYLLQDFIKQLFEVHGIQIARSFTRNGGAEQIDGAFNFDGWCYLVECRWRKKLANIRELDGLKGQVDRSGKQTMGLFISINGWSINIPKLLKQNPNKSLLLMDGQDIKTILEGKVSLPDLLRAKILRLNIEGEPC